jgi:dipeptidase E
MRRAKTIIAIGGGGFSTTKPDPTLCAYVLEQSGRGSPRVCYVATAVGDSETAIAAFYKMAKKLGAKPSHLSLYAQPLEPLSAFVLRHDVIYVSGGNTRNLLILWKAWGLDVAMRAAYERGIVLAGHSAGALCWFSAGVTDSYPGCYAPLRCLSFLRGSFCPHYDGEPKRRPVYQRLVRSGILPGGYAADDNVGLVYRDGRLEHIVTSRQRARAHRLRMHAGKLIEDALKPDIILQT